MKLTHNTPRAATARVCKVIFGGLLALSACSQADLPTPAEWTSRLNAASQHVAGVADPKERREQAEQSWLALARDFPVVADWILQDLGREATALLNPEQAEATENRLLAAAGGQTGSAPPQTDLWKRYFQQREDRRRQRLGRVLPRWGPLAFTEGNSYKMSFIGYTEGLSDARAERFFKPGARLTLLEFADGGIFGKARPLIEDAHGMLRDVDVSFDRRKLLFAWKKSDRLDDYHLHEYDIPTGGIRQLTFGLGRADYEPIYLPDGDVVFTSTRPEQSVPCWWTEISNLYRMDANGRGIRRLAVDQVHALYPQLMADGRLTYTRWDYSDRGQNYPHPLFSMRPDGQDQRAFYGANSWFPTSLLHARGIPDSPKIMAVAAGHHTHQQGKLVVIDPREGRDEGAGMHFIAPSRKVPYERVDRAMQDGDQFRYPYPISEDELLASYRPAWGAERFGLYWMNAAGERELLYAGKDLEVARMVPLGGRPAIATLPDEVDHSKMTGTYYVHDVYQGIGLEGVPRGEARTIRVVRLNYRAAGVGMTHNRGEGGGSLNSAPVGLSNTSWDVKEILGDAIIHADGSALFEVPAMESIYLQILDSRGQVIQTTRSWDTLRPGETKGCTGCHDKTNGNFHPFREEATEAWLHGVQSLKPFYGETRGFSFPKEIQPILDAKCTSCHDGSKPDVVDLRGHSAGVDKLSKRRWSHSYLNLLEAKKDGHENHVTMPQDGLVRWISKMSRPTELPPYHAGAARSPLMRLLESDHYEVELTTEEHHKLAAWIDLLVPFCGDYREGHAWSGRELDFYGYYETKRAWQKQEEESETAAHQARRGGLPMPPRESPQACLDAAFREVLATEPLARRDDGAHSLASHQPMLIDRLWLHARSGTTNEPIHLEIRDEKHNRVLAGAKVSSRPPGTFILLPEPLRSDRLVITTGTADTSVTLQRAFGLRVDEVPVVDGFHPFLEKHLVR